MRQDQLNQALIIFFVSLGILLLYLLAPILTPFLLGALFAYMADPVVKLFERFKCPHIVAVSMVFVMFFGVLTLLVLVLAPIVQTQIIALIENIPDMLVWVQQSVVPWLQEYININTVKATITASLAKNPSPLSVVLTSGSAIIHSIINIVLTPIVTFYLLRDWDMCCDRVVKLLPKSSQPTLVRLAKECDDVLSVFFRGQFLVMLALIFVYGIGLTLIGLKTGFIIGVIGGALSIVPYLGASFVLIVASLAALVQFTTVDSLLWVFAVFFVGQGLEGYVLIPYFIGSRIGLHPVVVIFAVMAGGTLFGFFGVLLALPVAAVGKVLLRYVNRRYLHVQAG